MVELQGGWLPGGLYVERTSGSTQFGAGLPWAVLVIGSCARGKRTDGHGRPHRFHQLQPSRRGGPPAGARQGPLAQLCAVLPPHGGDRGPAKALGRYQDADPLAAVYYVPALVHLHWHDLCDRDF
jgi:hypothetical protein